MLKWFPNKSLEWLAHAFEYQPYCCGLGVILVFISVYSLPALPLPHHKTPTLNTLALEIYIFQQYVHCWSPLISTDLTVQREFPLSWCQGLLSENPSCVCRSGGQGLHRLEKQLSQFFSWITTLPYTVWILNRNDLFNSFMVIRERQFVLVRWLNWEEGDASPSKGRRRPG